MLDLRKTLNLAHNTLERNGIDHAHRPLSQEMLQNSVKNSILRVYVLRAEDLVGLKIQAYKNDLTREFQDKADSLEEYFQFLEQYWMIFEPPKFQKPKKEYKLLLI